MNNPNFAGSMAEFKNRTVLFFIFIVIFLCYQCANIVPPKGGPKDEIPPHLDSLNSTPNYQTNYTNKPVVLAFDEWVVLQDVFNQVVVSPPTEYPLDIKLKKRNVTVQFDEREVLKENTTYTINFGNSIKDFTEGNVPDDLRYVLSTGDIIDSLEVKAKLVDIKTKKPIKDALLMLYTNLADSVLYTIKPYYFAKADTGGVVNIRNVRADTFKLIALVDNNLNYLLDGETEKTAFFDNPLEVLRNMDLGIIELHVPQKPMIFQGAVQDYGKISAYFNQPPLDVKYELTGDAPEIMHEERILDSLIIWYSDTSKIDWSITYSLDTLAIDTLIVNKIDTPHPKKLTGELVPESQRNNKTIKPDSSLVINWDRPLNQMDTSKIFLAKDSISNLVPSDIFIDQKNKSLLIINSKWQHPGNYFLSIDEKAVQDIFAVGNDSIGIVRILADDQKSYGTLTVNFDSLDISKYYVMQLVSNSGEIEEERTFNNESRSSFELNLLDPGNYTIQLIEDDNQNGRWDSGNYKLQIQPERIFIKVLPPIRANWEQTIDFKL